MARARRTLREEEKALWQAVARTVTPLPGRKPSRPEPVPKPALAEKPKNKPGRESTGEPTKIVFRQMVSTPVAAPRSQELYVGVRAPGVDNTQWRKLTRGKMPVDGRLDLHGYVVQEAFELFLSFMSRARSMNWRCIEIVTGMGSGPQGGAIRRELRHWLQRGEVRAGVLAVVHPHAANQGAVRVWLRRKR